MLNFMTGIVGSLRKFPAYDRITGMSKIARRLFVMNSFDGSLTILGVVAGSYIAKVQNPGLVVAVGLSTAVAVGISGLWGAFLTESAERARDLRDLEKQMLRKLSKSDIGEASRFAPKFISLIDGLSPVLASLVLLSPFFAAEAGSISIAEAYKYAFALAFAAFFMLGLFLGRISRENPLLAGARMMLAGLLCIIIILALGASGALA